MQRRDWQFSTHRRFARVEPLPMPPISEPRPENLSLLLSILRAPVTADEEALVNRLFIVRLLGRESRGPRVRRSVSAVLTAD